MLLHMNYTTGMNLKGYFTWKDKPLSRLIVLWVCVIADMCLTVLRDESGWTKSLYQNGIIKLEINYFCF